MIDYYEVTRTTLGGNVIATEQVPSRQAALRLLHEQLGGGDNDDGSRRVLLASVEDDERRIHVEATVNWS